MVATLDDIRLHAPNELLVATRQANSACAKLAEDPGQESSCQTSLRDSGIDLETRLDQAYQQMIEQAGAFRARYVAADTTQRDPTFAIDGSAAVSEPGQEAEKKYDAAMAAVRKGELDEADRRRVEEALASDPALQSELAEMRRLKDLTADLGFDDKTDAELKTFWGSVYNRMERRIGEILHEVDAPVVEVQVELDPRVGPQEGVDGRPQVVQPEGERHGHPQPPLQIAAHHGGPYFS